MPIINRIADFHDEMTAWRRDLHAHPETAFEEVRTSDFVAGKLAEFGYDVHRGLAGTGVVGTLKGAKPDNGRAIGLRADMDALNMEEANTFSHRSRHKGKMHGCGHDGHTTMLLGAARYLAETRNFAGTIHLIFQPAEEGAGGGRRMVEEGLFEKFPVESIYGMHNMPGIPVGSFGTRPGAILTAMDLFEIRVNGVGTHAAVPELGIDPIVAASHIVLGLQTIVSRELNPLMSVVVTITEFHAGTGALNNIPDHAILRGTARILNPEVRDTIEQRIRRIVDADCAGPPLQRGHQLSAQLSAARHRPGAHEIRDRRGGTGRRRRQDQSRLSAEHGLGGFLLHAGEEARRLCLHRQRAGGRRPHPS